mgnify:CR=1 FL=1
MNELYGKVRVPNMDFAYLFLLYAGWMFALIGVHECGHYLAGALCGIPAAEMRIRLLTFPQHVVLRDGDSWVSPARRIERYVELIWQHLKTKPRVFVYVSGGILLETVFTSVVGSTLLLSGQPKLAFMLVGLSLFLVLPWIIVDAIAVMRGRVVGDLSGLWNLARLPTILLVAFTLSVRGLILWQAAA